MFIDELLYFGLVSMCYLLADAKKPKVDYRGFGLFFDI
jgi:hypothetical protein